MFRCQGVEVSVQRGIVVCVALASLRGALMGIRKRCGIYSEMKAKSRKKCAAAGGRSCN